MNYRRSQIWLQKLRLTFSSAISGFLLIASIVTIVFFTFLLYVWIKDINEFNSISNYVMTFFLMVVFSLLFSTIAYFIHISNVNSYKIDNIGENDYFGSQLITPKINRLQNEISFLSELLKLMDSDIALTFLGYTKELNPIRLKDLIKKNAFEKRKYAVSVFRINSTEFYYISVVTAGFHGATHISNYFLADELFIHLEPRITNYPNLFFSFNNAITEKADNPTKFIRIKENIRAKIMHLENILIPSHQDFSSGKFVKINVFFMSYFLNLFGINQSYVLPISNWAKLNHIFFGIYRFLMQGTFISLLINDIATRGK